MTDHFSEEDARRIFARAAERQHAVQARGTGLTLAELQAIGREAGLDPDHVAAAVAEMHLLPEAEPVLVAGVDVTPRRSRVVAGELTDEMWEQWVSRLRRTYGSKGVPTRVGRIREWQSAPNSHLHVVAEPIKGGTRVTIETSKAAGASGPAGALWVGIGIAALLSLLFGVGDFDLSVWLLPALAMLVGVGLFIGSVASLSRWSDRRAKEFDALLDQFELIARDAAPATEGAPEPAPAIDLDALDGAPTGSRDAPTRRRQRG